jgi:3-oxoadipate enol-lactonase
VNLHHVRRGSGEPLLLVMGMSVHHVHWGEAFLAALERDFDCIAVDNRCTGLSPADDAEFTLPDLAEDAAGLLDELGIESAHVLGVSMGGMIAQHLALDHRDRVRSLVLGCTYAGGPGQQLAPQETMELLAAAMLSGDRARALRTGFELNVSGAFAAEEANWTAWQPVASTRPVPVAVIMRQMQAIAGHDVGGRLGDIAAPTLVVHGTEDRMLPYANAASIAERIPDARLETLEGVGHLFWIEQPERSAELVRAHCLSATAHR